MRLPLILGAGISVLVLAAFIAAPHLRSGAAKAAEQARDQVTLAERALHQYDHRLPNVGRLAPPADLKQADLAAVAEQARPNIEQGRKDLTPRLNDIRARAQKAGLPAPQADLPTPDANGIKRALAHYEQMLADNEQYLKQATQDARAAKQAGASVLGVSQAVGMVDYARGSRALAEASALRDQQQRVQAELLLADSQAQGYEAARLCAQGLEMTSVVNGLRDDLAEVQKLAAAAAARAEKLAAEVSQREQELAPVKAEQERVRDELLALEDKGFQAGDDASFESYRSQYQRLSTRARELQEQEELLRLGGLRGPKFAGDDYTSAEIQAGDPVVSLEMLQETAAAAQEGATRSSKAVAELQQQIKTATQSGQDSQEMAGRYAELVQALETRQAELKPQIDELARKANEKEEEALKAATDAASAFRSSQQAADGWTRAARDLQSQRDPERVNPRLKLMLEDKAMPALGKSAEAEALVLLGRIYAQRIEANRSLVADLKQVQDDAEQSDPALDALQAQIDQDTNEAGTKLQSAIKIYEELGSKIKPETKWVPQAALASAHALLARINPAQAAAHLSDALECIRKSTGGNEKSPYVRQYLEFQQHLERLAAGEKEPAEPPAEAEPTAEAEPAGNGD